MQNNVSETISEVTDSVWEGIKDFLDIGFHFGEGDKQIHITIGLVLLVAVSFFATSVILGWIRRLFTRKLDEVDKLKFISVFKFIKYVVYIIVVFSVMALAGFDVTPFLAASTAILIGVGLAMQELFQDVIGGIFIMIDKSLLVGDIIEIEGRVGRIIDIKLRTTRAITRDDKVIIIPNHKFITNTLFNYTQNHKSTRESVGVGVAYGSDTQKVKKLLLNCVDKQAGILNKPEPFVLFEDFGDSALLFRVYFFISDSFIDPRIKSEIRFRIDKVFRENNITIPFPQRDIHIFESSKKT